MCSIHSGISTKIWKLAEDVASLANLWDASFAFLLICLNVFIILFKDSFIIMDNHPNHAEKSLIFYSILIIK